MHYVFHFGDIWAAREDFLQGTLLTLRLSALAMLASLTVAILCGLARNSGPRWLGGPIRVYVEFIRNTPFLVQLYAIFFGLPVIGVRMSADASALLAMVLNGSAYTIEIVRAGIEGVGPGQREAATALGLRRLAAFRLIVLPQALETTFAPLGSQFILLMLTSSLVSAISANDLTAAALEVQSQTFRPFEAFLAATVIYLLLSLLFTGVFTAVRQRMFAGREPA